MKLTRSSKYLKGEVTSTTRILLITSWTLLLTLPAWCLLQVNRPPAPIPNYAAYYVCKKEPKVNDHANFIVPTDSTLTPALPGVELFSIAVPSQVTESKLKDTTAIDATKLDCLITICRSDGVVNTVKILPGATRFIVNPGLDTEVAHNRPPTVQDFVNLTKSTGLPTINQSFFQDLDGLLDSALLMMMTRGATRKHSTLFLYGNDCYYMYSQNIKSTRVSIFQNLTKLATVLLIFIWVIGILVLMYKDFSVTQEEVLNKAKLKGQPEHN